MTECFVMPNSKKICKNEILFLFIGILIGFLIALLLYCVFFSPYIPQPDTALTEYFQYIDKTAINETGSAEIFAILDASSHGDDLQRLNTIADLITNDYRSGVWNNENLTPFNHSQKYYYYKTGKFWIIPPYDDTNRNLAADPNWLIYNKIGSCRELSILFNDITRKAGFSSRIIRTGDGSEPYGTGATHWWNEIEIQGTNKTFDVLWYGQIKYHINNGSSWSGDREDFFNNSNSFSPKQLCEKKGVWITDKYGRKIEDVTLDYMDTYNCTY